MKKIIITVSCLLLATTIFYGQEQQGKLKPVSIYTGNTTIEAVRGQIKIKNDGSVESSLILSAINKKENERSVAVGFRGTDARKRNFTEGKTETIVSNPVILQSGKGASAQSSSIDLTVLINGQIPDKPIQKANFSVVLPKGANVIRCNMPNETFINRAGERVLEINSRNKYLTNLVVVYSLKGRTVAINKSISPKRIKKGSNVSVVLRITNNGNRALDNIVIGDNYDSRDFSSEDPSFISYKGTENDRRLVFERLIQSLQPNESIEVKYNLKANFNVNKTSLSAATATINGQLIGVSNKIKL